MKKLHLRLCGMAFMSLALTSFAANNLDFGSLSACHEAMDNYSNQAENLAFNYSNNSNPFDSFMNMSRFFANFATASQVTITCYGKNCSYTAQVGCVTKPELASAWNKLVLPLLDREVNQYLELGRYDNVFTNYYYLNCTYTKGSHINVNNCALYSN